MMMDTVLSITGWGIRYIKDPLRRNAFFMIITNVILAGFGFLFGVIAAHNFSTRDIGLATAVVSAANLLSMFALLGLNIGVIRFLSDEKNKSDMINSCSFIVFIFSIILALCFIGGVQIWSPALLFIKNNLVYAIVFIILVTFYGLFWLQYHIFIALRSAEYSIAQSVLTGFRILFLLFMTTMGSLGITASFASGFVIAVLAGIALVKKVVPVYRFAIKVSKKVIGNMIRFSLGNYLADNFKELPGRIIPLILVNVLSAEINAYFYIALMISYILFTAAFSTSYSLLAESSLRSEGLRRQAVKAIIFNLVVLIPAVVLIWFFGKNILSLFGASYAREAYTVLLLLAITSIPIGINEVYITVFRTDLKVRPVIFMRAFSAISTIILSYLLMRTMGLLGIGLGWLVTELVVMFCVTPFMFNRLVRHSAS